MVKFAVNNIDIKMIFAERLSNKGKNKVIKKLLIAR